MVGRLVEHAAEMPDRIVIPSSQRPAGSSDRLALDDRGRRSSRFPRASGVNALVARHADSVIETGGREPRASLPTSTRRRTLKRWKRRRRSRRTDAQLVFFACMFVSSPWRRIGPGGPRSRSSLAADRTSPTCGPRWRARAGAWPLLATVMIAVDEEYAGDDVPIIAGLAAGRHSTRQRRERMRRATSTSCNDRDHR